ncbi:redoxin domain-containing protein [Pseudorhizobium flavum]|uniref:redoxin domain-containing protein n=1 Tax=Pseudorhizobium flavum TaxID=1335061 RepID=UPI0031E558BD
MRTSCDFLGSSGRSFQPYGFLTVSADLLTQGSPVISFYRGVWCPYCNMELHTQEAPPQFQALGAKLMAISPQPRSTAVLRCRSRLRPALRDVGRHHRDTR